MATEVFNTETITLLDGEDVELRPLSIAKLRAFMRIWTEHMRSQQVNFQAAVKKQSEADEDSGEPSLLDWDEADNLDKQFDVLIKMCALGLEAELKGDKTDKQFTSYLNETLDQATVKKIVLVTGGLDLSDDEDPNPMTPA